MSSDSAIADILDAISPEDFLADIGVDFRVTPGRSGTQLNVKCCPRCGGNSWKVFLNAETGLGNCFHGSCAGEPGFNLFTFTQNKLGIDSKETFNQMKAFAKTSGWRPKRPSTAFVSSVPTEVKIPASIPLRDGNALPYLTARGFDGRWQEYFGWRYCAYGQYPYINAEGESRDQDYSKRVIIPVHDLEGKLVTFQGRDITDTQERKYLFPPQLPGTGKYLYNAHRVSGCHTLVINEGVMDVAATTIALRKHGASSLAAVGSFGLSLSGSTTKQGDDQYGALMQLKQKGIKRIIFMWDAEKNALLAACKEAQLVSRLGFDVAIAILPFGKDPNEVDSSVVVEKLDGAIQATSINLARIKMKALTLPT